MACAFSKFRPRVCAYRSDPDPCLLAYGTDSAYLCRVCITILAVSRQVADSLTLLDEGAISLVALAGGWVNKNRAANQRHHQLFSSSQLTLRPATPRPVQNAEGCGSGTRWKAEDPAPAAQAPSASAPRSLSGVSQSSRLAESDHHMVTVKCSPIGCCSSTLRCCGGHSLVLSLAGRRPGA